MAISFNKVPEIKSGDAIKSKHLADLGLAINQRLRSGLGDPTWRLVWYANSLATQIRRPDSSGFLWPSKSEWLEVYATVHPSEMTFPTAEAGGAEGANLATPIGQFVFGDPEGAQNNPPVLPEDERLLSVPMWSADHPPSTPLERWGIAKFQRGGWDPATGAMACPVFDAAAQHYRMTRDNSSPHGNSWGGFAPTPEILGTCGDGDSTHPPSTSYQIKFTHLSPDRNQDVSFIGTCARTENHVAAVRVAYPFRYYVYLWDSTGPDAGVVLYTAKDLLLSEYIEGPYSGGNVLTKQAGDHLPRVLNYFSAQYRGTSEQRAVAGSWNDHAFDTQRFFETQYLLAPAKGTSTGSPGQVSVVYPLFRRLNVGAITAGTKLDKVGGGTGHTVSDKHVVTCLLIETKDLANDCTIEVLANGVQVDTVTVTPTNPTDVKVLTKPIPKDVVVEIRVTNDLGFTQVKPDTGVTVEIAELMEYKPWPQDHFLVLRLGGCRIDLFNGTDGYGDDEQASHLLGNDYFRWGMISNLRGNASNPGSEFEINTNAVHEAARQLFRCVRILRPEQLVSYEVVGGKSILTFNRWTDGKGSETPPQGGNNPPPETETPSGEIVQDARYTVRASGSDSVTYDGTTYTDLEGFRGVVGVATYTKTGTSPKVYLVTQFLPDSDLGGVSGDCLAGIAPDPAPIPTGQIRWKRVYKVWGTSGVVTYNGQDYDPGQIFGGAANRNSFTSTGDAAVYELDGIRHTAEPENFTNEWMVGFQLKGYNENEASIFKPDAYSRYFSFSERCHFYPNPLSLNGFDARDAQAMRQFAYGDNVWLAPEAPTGYRYSLGLNDVTSIEDQTRKRNFYKSCRLYEPDLEIEKAELVNAPQGDLVKITMKGRFHYDPIAPASFGPDPNTWNVTALRAEPYRTTDNALREFLHHRATGINSSVKVGDSAENSQAYQQFDAPYGTVWPHIFFTKLIPTPYVDNNDTQDYWDTPFIHDQLLMAELYLRVICEGYVDGKTSNEYGCQTGIQAMFDYTFPNLCFDAFQHRWIRAFPMVPTQYIKEDHIRTDKPMGFGPLPNTTAAAEIYNLFAKATNKLTSVRVMLPAKFQQQKLEGTAYASVRATNPDGATRACESRPTLPGVIYEGSGPVPSMSAGPWEDSGGSGIDPGVNAGLEWSFASFDGGQTYACDGDLWVIRGVRYAYNFRWTLMDPDAALAIPEAWRTQIDVDGTYLGHMTATTQNQTKKAGPYEGSASCNGSPGWWPVAAGQYLEFVPNHVQVRDECGLFGNSGTISDPGLSAQVIAGGYNLGMCPVIAGSNAEFTPIPNDGFALTIPLVTPVAPINPPG